MKRFQGFSERFNVSTPFPVMEYTLCTFAAYLEDQGLTPKTIKVYLAAVTNIHSTLIWAIASLAFLGFFQLRELLVDSVTSYSPSTSLSWGNIAMDNITAPSMLK